ncbi:MAG TPA: IS30 family transposase [Candidatus Micrarchaeaceae archaeon]|nr:IS30 family transposase [Candidatus Micrarchaeaceae archaeon]
MTKTRLSLQEREEISLGLCRGGTLRQIARQLGRHASTVSREVRGGGSTTDYRAVHAADRARLRRRRPKLRKLAEGTPLVAHVCKGMAMGWSPQQVAARMHIEYPDDLAMRVSHETIYTWFYLLPKGELKRALMAGMRQAKDRRGVERRGHYGRHRIADMVSIDERPAEVADRRVPGHWEGDLMIGQGAHSAVGTLVERTTRFTMLVPLPHGRAAETTRLAIAETITTLPAALRHTLTWDQGTELAQHRQFSIDTGVAVYFAHHRSPWERGTNENTNGLLRQYLPKQSVMPHDTATLQAVAATLNGRPRRTLGWRTPAEAFSQLLESPVAPTG